MAGEAATGSACGWGRPRGVRGAGGLPSFPVVPGSVQVTPSGELVVLGPDAGVTGGYPVVGVLFTAGARRAGAGRPGDGWASGGGRDGAPVGGRGLAGDARRWGAQARVYQ